MGDSLRTREARDEDAMAVAPRLRDMDRNEIEARLGGEPTDVLRHSIRISDPCYAIIAADGRALGLFGVAPDREASEVGMVWLLGTHGLVRHRVQILRDSSAWIEALHDRYPILYNYIDARNVVHLGWLRACGFSILRKIEEFGVERRPFYEFERRRGRI